MSTDIQQQKQSNILLIGDSCIDFYIFGKCERLSAEAPVPVFKKIREESRPGMSLNVKENLHHLSENFNIIHVTNEKSIRKIRIVDDISYKIKHHLLRIDEEDDIDVLSFLQFCNSADVDDMIKSLDAVVISDYDKGFLTYDNIFKILDSIKTRRPDIKIFVDSKKKDLSCYNNVIFKLNEDEFKSVIKFPENYECIVTLGKRGALFKGTVYPASDIVAVDACGAGDTFLAALVTKYIETNSIEESIRFANICASEAVSHFGTWAVARSELEDEN